MENSEECTRAEDINKLVRWTGLDCWWNCALASGWLWREPRAYSIDTRVEPSKTATRNPNRKRDDPHIETIWKIMKSIRRLLTLEWILIIFMYYNVDWLGTNGCNNLWMWYVNGLHASTGYSLYLSMVFYAEWARADQSGTVINGIIYGPFDNVIGLSFSSVFNLIKYEYCLKWHVQVGICIFKGHICFFSGLR